MDVLQAIRVRRSVRSYSAREIPAESLAHLRAALRAAPSACNFQPWHFVFVHDPQLRRRLGEAANHQDFIAGAPLIVVACGLPDQAAKKIAGYRSSLDIDVAIALNHLTLAAVADGLGTCWIGTFDEEQIKTLLGIPPDARVVGLTPVGYPASPELICPLENDRRKPEREIFSVDRY